MISHFAYLILVLLPILGCDLPQQGAVGSATESGSNHPALAVSEKPLEITIDASAIQGVVPKTLEVGTFGSGFDVIFDWYLQDNQSVIGFLRDQLHDFGRSKGLSENEWQPFSDHLDRTYVGPFLKAQQNGAELGFDFEGMPEWLSANPGKKCTHPNKDSFVMDNYSAPRDYVLYTRYFRKIVQHFQSRGLKNPWYAPWNEPEWTFVGTIDDYMEMYKAMVLAVKGVDKNLMVGGPSLSNLDSHFTQYSNHCSPQNRWIKVGQSSEKFIELFIKKASSMALPELNYDRLPIDFIDWHFPSQDIEGQKALVENLLMANGYDPKKVKFRIGEWQSLNGWEGDLASTEYNAAYYIKRVAQFANNNIYHTFTSFTDQSGWAGGGWTDVGIFFGCYWGDNPNNSRESVIKPVYNALKALSIFNGGREGQLGNLLEVNSPEDPFVTTLASQTADQSATRVLLSNFVMEDEILPAYLAEILGSSDKNNSTSTGLLDFIWDTEKYQATPRLVALKIHNLPFKNEKVVLHSYLIDQNHSNACNLNKVSEPKLTNRRCGVDGEVDQAVALARRNAFFEALDYLLVQAGLSVPKKSLLKRATACSSAGLDVEGCLNFLVTKIGGSGKVPGTSGDFKSLFSTVFNQLVYYGEYQSPLGTKITSSPSIREINQDSRISLEGSRNTMEGLVNEFGDLETTIILQPNSVVLLEVRGQ